MRELVLKMSVSIDGFVAGVNGETQWMFGGDPEARAWSVEVVSGAGLHVMGSRTFRDMASYWPTSTDLFAPAMNRIPKAVFTKRGADILKAVDAGSHDPATLQPGSESWAESYVANGDLAAEIAQLKTGEGKPMIAHGGAAFARSLVTHGLVDRYVLLIHPIALGNGLPIFSDLAVPRSLELIDSRTFPRGSVAHIYRPT